MDKEVFIKYAPEKLSVDSVKAFLIDLIITTRYCTEGIDKAQELLDKALKNAETETEES